MCSGNHDLNARNSAGEQTADWLAAVRSAAIAVDGDSVTIGDTLFTVVHGGTVRRPAKTVERVLETAAQRRSGRWVWIYHAPPQGLLSWHGSDITATPRWPNSSRVSCADRRAVRVNIHEAPVSAAKASGGRARVERSLCE